MDAVVLSKLNQTKTMLDESNYGTLRRTYGKYSNGVVEKGNIVRLIGNGTVENTSTSVPTVGTPTTLFTGNGGTTIQFPKDPPYTLPSGYKVYTVAEINTRDIIVRIVDFSNPAIPVVVSSTCIVSAQGINSTTYDFTVTPMDSSINTFVVAWTTNTYSSYYMAYKITGTTVTTGTIYSISTTAHYNYTPSRISNTTLLFPFAVYSTNLPKVIVLSITDTTTLTMSTGMPVLLNSAGTTDMTTVEVDTNKFLVWYYMSGYGVKCGLVTVSGINITLVGSSPNAVEDYYSNSRVTCAFKVATDKSLYFCRAEGSTIVAFCYATVFGNSVTIQHAISLASMASGSSVPASPILWSSSSTMSKYLISWSTSFANQQAGLVSVDTSLGSSNIVIGPSTQLANTAYTNVSYGKFSAEKGYITVNQYLYLLTSNGMTVVPTSSGSMSSDVWGSAYRVPSFVLNNALMHSVLHTNNCRMLTVPIYYNDTELFGVGSVEIGIAETDGSTGDVEVCLRGLSLGNTALRPGAVYYQNVSGDVSRLNTSAGTTVGLSLSSTELLISNGVFITI